MHNVYIIYIVKFLFYIYWSGSTRNKGNMENVKLMLRAQEAAPPKDRQSSYAAKTNTGSSLKTNTSGHFKISLMSPKSKVTRIDLQVLMYILVASPLSNSMK